MESTNASTTSGQSSDLAPRNGRLKQGDTVGSRFVIDEWLRDDVPGSTYCAVDQKSGKKIDILMMDRDVAVDRGATDRLRAAVKQTTTLTHKNIVGVFGMGKEGRRRYIAREHVDGQTLAQLLDKKAHAGKQFSLKGAYNLIAHVCNALQHARSTMRHTTLRPSVILVNRTGRVKVSDFGLAELRPSLEARRDELCKWDRACLPLEGARDDLHALGVLIAQLLSGEPGDGLDPRLPSAIASRLPAELAGIIERCIKADHPERYADPMAVKAAIQEAVERSRGAEQVVQTRPPASGGASVEVLDVRGTPSPARIRPKPTANIKSSTGFVIPELGKSKQVDDDGTTKRWLVQQDGVDFGPFTLLEVKEKLFDESVDANTELYDIETDDRLPLNEFGPFEEILRTWMHEKSDRDRKRQEATVAAGARRRNRLFMAMVLLVVGGAGGGIGGWYLYQSNLPAPESPNLQTMALSLSASVPKVRLPEELSETPAETKERRQKVAAKRAKVRNAAERRQMIREAQEAASSTLDAASGTGAKFDRQAFDRAIGGRQGRLMKCLQKEARRDPSVKTIKVAVTIVPKGKLINVKMPGASSAGTRCARKAYSGLKVPAFDGTNVKVTLPFTVR